MYLFWSYPLSINFSHQLKINTASVPDTTNIETGFNQRKPPHRMCGHRLDSSIDTVSHDTLISNNLQLASEVSSRARESFPPASLKDPGCHLHCSTPPVKRVCYADDIIVWTSGPKIPQLESMLNCYMIDVGIYLKENSLLIFAPKSTVTLFTPDTHQFQTHPKITLEDTPLSLELSPKIL